MMLKEWVAKIWANNVAKILESKSKIPGEVQKREFEKILSKARSTVFGRDHHLDEVSNVKEFQQAVPIRDYEQFLPYIDRVKAGEKDVLWPGIPLYLTKTSGTTSGTKYIPISSDSISNHIDSARNALLSYIADTGNTSFINGKMIFLQGSPKLEKINGIPTGRLSGIVAHHVPAYLQRNRLPSFETNCIEDWEQKIDAIINETLPEKMTLISGIPPWVQMYFERILEKTGKRNIKEVFPHFSLFVYGGVNFEPYRKRFEQLIGGKVDSIETYPASEGFIAFQNKQQDPSLLMVLDKGIFFEFVPLEEYGSPDARRLTIDEVELNKNYAVIMTTNAGLYAYSIGDTVKFVSKYPHKIIVSGRVKHFISAFGEHVIAEDVEEALKMALNAETCAVNEFHVAPQVNPPEGGLPYHQWYIEFEQPPSNLERFAQLIDEYLQQKNVYYKDLRAGNMLRTLVITPVRKNAFTEYMKSIGKLGGQNKLPRLANNRNIADELEKYKI